MAKETNYTPQEKKSIKKKCSGIQAWFSVDLIW